VCRAFTLLVASFLFFLKSNVDPFRFCNNFSNFFLHDVTTFETAFAITKTDHRLEIDAIGVRRCMRGLGIGEIFVKHYLKLAEARQPLEDGDDWYEVEAVQNAIGFWRKMGFDDIPKEELPSYRTKNKTCLMMRRPLWDVVKEAEAERIAAEKRAIAEADD